MAESVAQRIQASRSLQGDKDEVIKLLQSVVTDLTAVKASIAGITAKLDADAGVTDTNYAALWNTTLVLNTTN